MEQFMQSGNRAHSHGEAWWNGTVAEVHLFDELLGVQLPVDNQLGIDSLLAFVLHVGHLLQFINSHSIKKFLVLYEFVLESL